jgi:hypothetical protein
METRIRVTLAVGGAALALAGVFSVGGAKAQPTPPYDPSVVDMLEAGLDAEAPPPSSYGMVPLAVENAAYFVEYRSGVLLSEDVKKRLVDLEQATMLGWSNGETRLSREEVKQVLNDTFVGQLKTVTDAQIDAATANSFRVLPGFRPENADSMVQLRGNGAGVSDPALFRQKAREFRDGQTVEALGYRAAARALIGDEVDRRCDLLAYACPAGWNVPRYSPYRVFLVAYALATDDQLGGSYTDVENQMKSVEKQLLQSFGVSNPCAGKPPYGDSGYVYRSPASAIFGPAGQMELLDRIDALH